MFSNLKYRYWVWLVVLFSNQAMARLDLATGVSGGGLQPEELVLRDFDSDQDPQVCSLEASHGDYGPIIFMSGETAPWLNPGDGTDPADLPPNVFPGKKDQRWGEGDVEYTFRRFKQFFEGVERACKAKYPDGDATKVDRCIAESIAKVIDLDGDGKISKDELFKFLKKLNGWTDWATEVLRDKMFPGGSWFGFCIPKFDQNGDGFLDAQELEELYKWLKENMPNQ